MRVSEKGGEAQNKYIGRQVGRQVQGTFEACLSERRLVGGWLVVLSGLLRLHPGARLAGPGTERITNTVTHCSSHNKRKVHTLCVFLIGRVVSQRQKT